ncbi:hypothetical protein JYQ62_06510 [Nostoc sp. UHCC 0702]|nr:hypothetical protein JYQ62_06510 [Nostoc sp. UHCC 0702]
MKNIGRIVAIDKNYYRANISALMIVSNKIINEILNCIFREIIPFQQIYSLWLAVKSGSCSLIKYALYKVLYYIEYKKNSPLNKTEIKYRPLLISLLEDSLILINDYHKNIGISELEHILNNAHNKNIGIVELESLLFPVIKPKLPKCSDFYDACYQLIHGELIFEDPSVKNDVSPVIIRMMIELRIKWGLGISGCFKNETPIGMSHFFEVLKEFEQTTKIKLEVKVYLIERMYKWANIFIHGGIKTYSWLPGFALDFLSPLFDDSGCGLQVKSKPETLDEFKEALKEKLSQTDRNPPQIQIEPSNIEIEPYLFPPICLSFDEFKSRSESAKN